MGTAQFPNFGQGTYCPHEDRSVQNQHPSTACHENGTCLVFLENLETSKTWPPYWIDRVLRRPNLKDKKKGETCTDLWKSLMNHARKAMKGTAFRRKPVAPKRERWHVKNLGPSEHSTGSISYHLIPYQFNFVLNLERDSRLTCVASSWKGRC